MIDMLGNYKFKDQALLTTALTHSSYSKDNYERLEFLGDSILDFVVGDYFYKNSEESEGSLTKIRAQFVSEAYLSKVFERLDIEKYVLLGKSYQGVLSKSIKADIMEALIAVVYLESGFEKAKKFTYSIINLGNYKTMKNIDYKTQLQELVQANKQKVTYKTLSKTGKSHDPIFEVGVFVGGEMLSKASASSKHKAEQLAASLAIKKVV